MLRCSDVRLSQTASTEQAPGRAQRRAEGGGPVRGAVGTDVPRVDTAGTWQEMGGWCCCSSRLKDLFMIKDIAYPACLGDGVIVSGWSKKS